MPGTPHQRTSILATAQTRQRRAQGRRRLSRRAGILVGIVAGVWGLTFLLRGHLAGQTDQYHVALAPLQWQTGDIAWADGEAKNLVLASLRRTVNTRLHALGYERPRGSLLDASLVADVYEAVSASPWVAECQEVRKRIPHGLSIRVRLNAPQLAVAMGERVHLVDAAGMVLPLVFTPNRFETFNGEMTPSLRIVTGATALPQAGLTCRTPAIRAALAVDTALTEHDASAVATIARIDVANVGGVIDPTASEVVLLAHTGDAERPFLRLLWGRDPASARFGENSPEAKVELLAAVSAQTNGFHGIDNVDVRFPDPVWDRLFAE